jgi:hypothetical protein
VGSAVIIHRCCSQLYGCRMKGRYGYFVEGTTAIMPFATLLLRGRPRPRACRVPQLSVEAPGGAAISPRGAAATHARAVQQRSGARLLASQAECQCGGRLVYKHYGRAIAGGSVPLGVAAPRSWLPYCKAAL